MQGFVTALSKFTAHAIAESPRGRCGPQPVSGCVEQPRATL
jgi:hypothetical protein